MNTYKPIMLTLAWLLFMSSCIRSNTRLYIKNAPTSSSNSAAIPNTIPDSPFKSLCETLRGNRSHSMIKKSRLNLSEMPFVANRINMLAEAMYDSNVVIWLTLDNNNLGNSGAQAIAKLLENNDILSVVDLKHNNIGNEGARALIKALEYNYAITHLDLSGNDAISNDLKSEITKYTERNLDPEFQKKVRSTALARERINARARDKALDAMKKEDEKFLNVRKAFVSEKNTHRKKTTIQRKGILDQLKSKAVGARQTNRKTLVSLHQGSGGSFRMLGRERKVSACISEYNASNLSQCGLSKNSDKMSAVRRDTSNNRKYSSNSSMSSNSSVNPYAVNNTSGKKVSIGLTPVRRKIKGKSAAPNPKKSSLI